jgi:hypothetical protein
MVCKWRFCAARRGKPRLFVDARGALPTSTSFTHHRRASGHICGRCPADRTVRNCSEGIAPHSSIYTLPDDLAKAGLPGAVPAPVQVRASSPSFGAWSPDGKLLACSIRDRTGVLSSSYTATVALVSSAALPRDSLVCASVASRGCGAPDVSSVELVHGGHAPTVGD